MGEAMERALGKVEQFRKAQEEYQRALSEDGKAALGELFKEFFEANPAVRAFTWTQYTPHFNDGDPCTFSVHDLEIAYPLVLEGGEDNPEADGYDGDCTANGVDYGYEYIGSKVEKKYPGITALESAFRKFEDVCEATFGDGVRVVVTREGFFEDEYDHD